VALWSRIFAATYDLAMARVEEAGLAAHRRALLSRASGRVIEIGGGTGANLPFYGNGVTELVLTEPEEPMARRLERRLRGYRVPARVERAPAERLPLESDSFDCAVSTLVLCTVADPARALAELRRVLRPGGRLLFIEHVRSDDPRLARWQDRLRRPWSWVGHGCQPNRSTVDAIREAGFSVRELRSERLPKLPRIVSPLVVSVAARPA
jgi:ubiquinone/menaquinone biosynthesis C-methylase UbiE